MITKPLKCPRCKKPVAWEDNPFRPFCSDKCRLIDLGRWAEEEYRIPGEKAEKEDPDNIIQFPGNRQETHR